ncbi:MAG: CehA/McbA family metallohydrolase domain-containing protein, partial [Planctomycetota bacterium]
HTSGTNMGTDWRDNDSKVEPIVEIYQGCRQSYEMPDAPRSNTADHSLGGWRPFGFVSLALKKGFRLGFQSSSDHISTHISYCNVWAEAPTREAILAAMKARHVYGSTDNIIAEFRCGDRFMGDEFRLKAKPSLKIRLTGTQPFAKVHVIKDGNYVHSIEPDKREVDLEWTDFDPTPGVTSYYYVRGEQTDGELVWVSPMWITYKP